MSEDLRGRFKYKPKKHQPEDASNKSTDDSIFGIWEDQRRMQAEEDKMAKELAETKKKAKELSKTLRKHRYGESREDYLQKIKQSAAKVNKLINKSYNSTVKLARKSNVAKTDSKLPMELEEPVSVSRKKVDTSSTIIRKSKKTAKQKRLVTLFKKSPKAIVLACCLVVIGVLFVVTNRNSSDNISGVLSAGTETPQDGRTEEKPGFKVLYPGDKKDLVAVTRKSPSGVLIHTFLDSIDGTEIEITQQELPAILKENSATELQKIAKSFQATDIIQIDETLVYHGLDEKTSVQSLFTIKSGTLISIRSAQKLSDDKWAAYVLSLE